MRRKTHEEFVKELFEKHPNIEVCEQYINTDTKIKVMCKVCGNIYSVRPIDLLRSKSTGCPKCSYKLSGIKRSKPYSQFKKELYEVSPNIKVIGKYINNHTKINLMCKICGNTWEATPNSLIGENNTGCPKCSLKKQIDNRRKSHEEFVEELNNISPNIEILGTYINNHTKIKCKCKTCNKIWFANPNDLTGTDATGCPNCKISKGEKRIRLYFESLNINYIPQKKFSGLIGIGGGLLSYDFYLQHCNLLIEYQGAFHDGSIKTGFQTPQKLKSQQEHDKRKREYAKLHNIDLLEIWYWDFDKIEQILNEKLNINNNQKSA